MGNFQQKIDIFLEIFLEQNGYVKVLEGLQNTVTIAVVGLIVGSIIGTLIAAVRVMPKYKRLPRVLNSICGFYVAMFRGTPMVVQLLVFYYVLFPLIVIEIIFTPLLFKVLTKLLIKSFSPDKDNINIASFSFI